MAKKLTGKALAAFEANRDVWQEVANAVRETEGGRRKQVKTAATASHVASIRLKSRLSQSAFAAALGVSKRTLEQWEQGRRKPSGAAQKLLTIADRHPEVFLQSLAS